MKQRTLLELVQPAEPDYVEHFRLLAVLNVEIRRNGPTWERLLRKSILEMDVGNFSAGLDAARDAIDLRPGAAEAYFQEGMALLLLAFQKAGALAASAGSEAPVGSTRTLLEQAVDAFDEASRINPGDQECQEDVATLSAFLEEHKKPAKVEEALRALWPE